MRSNFNKTLCIFFFFTITSIAHSATILNGVAQGQFTETGSNFGGTDITVVGFLDNRHGFLTFDLSAFTDNISNVTLHINVGAYLSVTGDFNLDFFDYVSGNDAQLKTAQTNIAVWEDLGNGSQYGAVTVSEINEPDNTTLNILLNTLAVTDLNNSRGGLFTIGISSDNNPDVERMLWGNTGDFQASLELNSQVNVPEPASLTLLGIGLAGFGFLRKKKKT